MRIGVRVLDIVIILVIGVLWGLNWTAVKFLLTEIEPLTIRVVSFTGATIILAAIAIAIKQPLRIPIRELFPAAFTGLFVIFGFNVLTSLGQVLVDTSQAAIIGYTMPAITAILAALFLKEPLSSRVISALTIAMVGLAILASENPIALFEKPLGPVIMLGAALSWAIGNVALKAKQWSLPPLSLTVWFFAFSSLLIWPTALIVENPWKQPLPSLPILLTLAFHVLGPTVICYVLWTILVSRLPATVAAISTLIAPVVGVVSAALLLGDNLTWQRILALFAIVLSITITLVRPRPIARKGKGSVEITSK
ncbi:MAG: DMT family transporter [Pseudomonadota bacterium]